MLPAVPSTTGMLGSKIKEELLGTFWLNLIEHIARFTEDILWGNVVTHGTKDSIVVNQVIGAVILSREG
jgi:hypothetical protein